MQSKSHSRPLHIFLSFAHEDRAFRDNLDKHLTAFQKTGLIDDWHKQEIPPGSVWQDVIDEQLNQADIILLFITPNFIASNYCYGVQMKQALEKHDAGVVRVIPILFRPSCWQDLPIAKLQGLPTSGSKTVSEWKNKDRAYLEIVEGIKRAIDELTAKSTDQTTPSTHDSSLLWNVPYPRNRFFTAREELLLSLHEAFVTTRENSICMQVLSGLGGIGKTQVALEYAHRYRNDYHAIFWLKGDTTEDLFTDFSYLATLLNLPERKEADQQIVIAAVKRFLSQTARWLIIIDNLDSIELLDDLVPVKGQGDILITTRKQAAGTIATLSDIEKMTLDEGALFLLRRAKVIAQNVALNTAPTSAVEHARTICQRMDGLPLALDQAGAYIEETKIGLASYIKLYDKHEAALLKQRRKFATGHPNSIATTLALSIATIEARNPAFTELLSVCAFLHPDAIPTELFNLGASDLGATLQALIADELVFNSALEALLDLSLLKRNSDTETISIHRLVQVVLKDEMHADTQRLWTERVVKALCRLFPEPEVGVWQQCQQYLPHVQIAADLIKKWSLSCIEAARLLSLAGRYLYTIANYTEARMFCEQALAIYGQIGESEHPDAAHTLRCLGNIDESLGDYPHAQHYYEQALVIAEHTWGAEHPDTAYILNDLGELFHTLDQFPLAEDYYRRALAIREKSFGIEHPDTASSLNNVAAISEEQGHYEQAEELYKQALRLRERLLGPHHPDTAESLGNVARFYRIIGKYSLAQPLYERAIAAYEEALGPEHPRLATYYNNFAVFCITLGRYVQAEQLLTQALKIRTQLFGLQDTRTAGSWNHLARVYCKQGHYKQAKTLYEQALSICEAKLGRQHSSTTSIIINMGEWYLLQGDNKQAETLLTEALTSIIGEQESKPPSAVPALNLLGQIYLTRGEYERAEDSLTEALAIRQKSLGKMHPETAISLKSLGDLAVARNDNEQAETFYQQALAVALVPLGADHPDVIVLVERLTKLLQKMGKENDVRILAEKVRLRSSE